MHASNNGYHAQAQGDPRNPGHHLNMTHSFVANTPYGNVHPEMMAGGTAPDHFVRSTLMGAEMGPNGGEAQAQAQQQAQQQAQEQMWRQSGGMAPNSVPGYNVEYPTEVPGAVGINDGQPVSFIPQGQPINNYQPQGAPLNNWPNMQPGYAQPMGNPAHINHPANMQQPSFLSQAAGSHPEFVQPTVAPNHFARTSLMGASQPWYKSKKVLASAGALGLSVLYFKYWK